MASSKTHNHESMTVRWYLQAGIFLWRFLLALYRLRSFPRRIAGRTPVTRAEFDDALPFDFELIFARVRTEVLPFNFKTKPALNGVGRRRKYRIDHGLCSRRLHVCGTNSQWKGSTTPWSECYPIFATRAWRHYKRSEEH